MDVVPVFPEQWSHPPFAADIDDDGRIFARGAQDMKAIGVLYLAAIRAIKQSGQTLQRTLHLTYVPDEETDAIFGMKSFVHHDIFKSLNIGFAIDEGMTNENDIYRIFYGERSNWSMYRYLHHFIFILINHLCSLNFVLEIMFKCSGHTGHGSILWKNTAGEKLSYITQKLYEFRNAEVLKLENNPNLEEGDVNCVNLTILNGGVLMNVIPAMFTATFDMRFVPDFDLIAFQKQVNFILVIYLLLHFKDSFSFVIFVYHL